MLRFMIKLPFRIIAAPVWLVLAAVNIVLVFLVGLSAGFCYLIAGISVVTEVLSIGFGISTDWTMKSAIITTVVFLLFVRGIFMERNGMTVTEPNGSSAVFPIVCVRNMVYRS